MVTGKETSICKTRFRSPIAGIVLAIATSTTPAHAAPSHAVDSTVADRPVASDEGKQSGNASFYAKHFTGRRTASGERYDPTAMTAAHRTLPMGTRLRVTNPRNDRSVIVTVNDRGRLPHGRVVDVSSAAADALDMRKSGVTRVETHVVGKTAAATTDTTTSAETTAPTPR